MKKFALLFVAVFMVAFAADESFAQCGGGGGGFYGGGGRSFVGGNQFRGSSYYRPAYRGTGVSVNFGTSRGFNSFNNFNRFGRSGYGNFNRGRSFYGGGRSFYGRY